MRAAEEEESSDDEELPSSSEPGSSNNQLIVVSNTLPILLERVPQTGRWKATKTTAGLDKLMCLTGVRSDLDFLWVGWVGQHIPKHEHESVRRLLLQHNCLPVFISSDVATRHNTFSSDVLWPLFHYVSEAVALTFSSGLGTGGDHSSKRFSKQDWRAYESANESFADTIAEIYNEGDSVWIHDYHLMLLPSLLRQRIPLCHIGWFLHTPFPSYDVYSRLPVRSQLLSGVLQADLAGFQTFDYERHFLSTCQRLLGVECSHKGVRSSLADHRDHFTSIGVFPIGISVEPFAKGASSTQTLLRVNELQSKFGAKRIILGIDRLDNIKGIPHKLMAMEVLLNRFSEWQHNVVLIQIGISSRTSSTSTVNSVAATSSGNAGGAVETHRSTSDAKYSSSPESGSYSGGMSSPSRPKDASTGSDTVAASLAGGGMRAATPSGGAATPSGSASQSAAASGSTESHTLQPLEMSSHSYRNLLAHVNQLVGRINGQFGTLDYAPIHFIHQETTSHEELCALYDLADVCLVTSTRDGMNLVSHEFVVCQQHFMRKKEERLKASRAASRSHTSPTSPPATKSASVDDHPALSSAESSSTKNVLLSPTASTSSSHATFSPTKILTEWEGEEGGPGVLILSEFAGSAQSLSGAMVINPWNTEDLAVCINQALSMCRTERELRQQKLYRYVSTNTATAWSMQFLSELGDAVAKNRQTSVQLPKLDRTDIVQAYRTARNRVIILDYDRTLTPQHSLLPLAAVGPNFKALLDTLSSDERNTVFIVSGRERKFLETWLNGVRVGVAAEDGYFYRMNLQNPQEVWKTMSKFHFDVAVARVGNGSSAAGLDGSYFSAHSDTYQSRRSMSVSSQPSYSSYGAHTATIRSGGGGSSVVGSDSSFDGDDSSWKDLVLPLMLMFTDRTPGSYIEDKESSLTWHYDDADPQFGEWQAKDMQIILERQLIGTALDVYKGHQSISVEHEGCTKTRVIEAILKHLSLPQQVAKKKNCEVDFVLCVCDDVTDDQMFQTLNTLVEESKERHEEQRKRAEQEKRAAAAARSRRHSIGTAPSSATTKALSSLSRLPGSTSALNHSASQGKKTVMIGRARSGSGGKELVLRQRRRSRSPVKVREQTSAPQKRLSGVSAGQQQADEDTSDDDEDDLDESADGIHEDNKVAFSRLQNVPVRLAENVALFTVVVGTDVQHSGAWSYAVDTLTDVRKVLKDFIDESRWGSSAMLDQSPSPSPPTAPSAGNVSEASGSARDDSSGQSVSLSSNASLV